MCWMCLFIGCVEFCLVIVFFCCFTIPIVIVVSCFLTGVFFLEGPGESDEGAARGEREDACQS